MTAPTVPEPEQPEQPEQEETTEQQATGGEDGPEDDDPGRRFGDRDLSDEEAGHVRREPRSER